MHRWASTQGDITASSFEERKHQEGFFSGRYYKPHVSYQYTVDGKTYTGKKFSSQNFTIGLKEEAQEIMAKFPPGKKVMVYYDPDEPTQSVLSLPNHVAAHVFQIAGGALGLITLAVLIGK